MPSILEDGVDPGRFFQDVWDSQMQLDGAGTKNSWLWFSRLLLASLGWLFCGIRGSLLGLFSIAVFNIIINSFAHCFKLDTFNLYFSLSFYRRSSIDVIFAPCLISFKLYFNRNINLSMQSSD